MTYVLMFVVCVFLGLSYSFRTQAIVHDRAIISSIWTAISVLIATLIVTHAVKDPFQLVPICLGQAMGNYIAMRVRFFRE